MVRNIFILVLLASGLYAASTVPLGRRTLAEHIRMIGKTPEAQELVEGTKSKLGPSMGKVKQAVIDQVKQSVNQVERELREQAGAAAKPSPTPAKPPQGSGAGYVQGQPPQEAR